MSKICNCNCHRCKGILHCVQCCNECYKLGTVLVTGGSSMIGRQLVPLLRDEGFEVFAPSKMEMNCLVLQSVYDYFDKHQPDYVIHLAGYNGGIEFNKRFPADIYMQTAWMALSVLGAASFYSKKVVSVLPSCAYFPGKQYIRNDEWGTPYIANDGVADVLYERNFAKGEPHESVACHGLAKRILFDYSRQLHKQFKLNAVSCVLNNCYGPNARHDEPLRLKVADALIQRFCDTKANGGKTVQVWGTGQSRREFLFAKDAAIGILKVLQHYDDPTEVINIGSGTDVSIKELAELIRDIVDPSITIEFDTSKPDGQMKKMFDNTKMKNLLRWEPSTELADGIKETVDWYNNFRGYL